MRAWVQQVSERSNFYLGSVQAAHWFALRGYEIVPFEFADVAAGGLDRDLLEAPGDMVLRAGVETVRAALARAGRPEPPVLDLPDSLAPWFGRPIWRTTLGQIRADVERPDFEPCHIKPLFDHKRFTGTVIRAFRDLIPTAALPNDLAVLAQSCVEFVSEWRAYVLRDEILHVGRYRGDPLLFPDRRAMQAALAVFADRPIAFGMDWGVTRDGATLLVEVNDGYSLGNYGLRGPEYTAMLEARWRQLMGLSDNGIGRMITGG